MAAPLPTPSGVIHFRALYTLGESTPDFGFGWDQAYTGGPPSTADLTSMATEAFSALDTHLSPFVGTGYALVQCTAVDLANPSTVEGSYSGSSAGTLTGAGLPASTALVVIFRPDRRYRGSRPKAFLPVGVNSSRATERTWDATFAANVATAFQSVITDVASSPYGSTSVGASVSVSYIGPPYHVVTSPTTGRARNVGTPRTPPLVIDTLSIDADTKLATQRRRLH